MRAGCGASLSARAAVTRLTAPRGPARRLREAANFYVWDSEDAAKAFFTDQLLERVTELYGVPPTVEFVQIATLVENTRT
jgi:hypothetical protein